MLSFLVPVRSGNYGSAWLVVGLVRRGKMGRMGWEEGRELDGGKWKGYELVILGGCLSLGFA
jgi:hypothetical protein